MENSKFEMVGDVATGVGVVPPYQLKSTNETLKIAKDEVFESENRLALDTYKQKNKILEILNLGAKRFIDIIGAIVRNYNPNSFNNICCNCKFCYGR